ncbi:uncharacterized protein B0H18DRAFT_931426 [Fomitopsis serialis]|uniref:uncharacterized protein n=1 Tax=Fomitopsis serialis TaxID=139415 RepID=UPI0020072D11|nr:uncharacterized protein B0H18DRAFT_875034 [Neoantrodia serialis]XP_047895276.1 uncharacterized protein B0H18DRAFT_931426 [Neoantrodia serialis]KAH9928181.1 hypothetical protein B0H18DRAFT_875034 [Neoantrodia serialis]KAH9929258.1 hypothetical protein B0H18DRAFT_931426 [Neoantrodia serialis]
MREISNPTTNIHFVGQVLTLTQEDASTWIWTGEFESFNAIDGGDAANTSASRKSTLIELSAQVTQAVKATLAPQLSDPTCFVWKFKSGSLSSLTELMWARVKENQHLIPVRTPTPTFPLRASGGGEYIFTSEEGTAALEMGPQQGCANCFCCDAEVSLKKMRDHIGTHILAKMLSLPDPSPKKLKMQVGKSPCGFCGRTGTCKIGLRKTRNALRAESDCRLFSQFNIASAAVSTKSGPSTNRPVICKICEANRPPQRGNNIDDDIVFWSYNMQEHLAAKHPDAPISAKDDISDSVSRNERIYCGLEKGKPDAKEKGDSEAKETAGKETAGKETAGQSSGKGKGKKRIAEPADVRPKKKGRKE